MGVEYVSDQGQDVKELPCQLSRHEAVTHIVRIQLGLVPRYYIRVQQGPN